MRDGSWENGGQAGLAPVFGKTIHSRFRREQPHQVKQGTSRTESYKKSEPLGATNYLYDGNDLIQEADSSGTVLAKYTGENEIDEPLSEFRSGTASYYEQDGQGSISSLSNSGGTLANTYIYDSFGKLTNSTGSISNPLQYTSREFDPETQLYFNRARYRDSETGRWLSEDPIGFLGAHDFYSYVVNNPLKYRDPMGWQSQMPSCYPDCTHTQEEIQNMEREHEATMERILPPKPPGAPPIPHELMPTSECEKKIRKIKEASNKERWKAIFESLGIVDTAAGAAEHWGPKWVERIIPAVDVVDEIHLDYSLLKIELDEEQEIRRVQEEYWERIPGEPDYYY
jgi:RHS repeat-associated protein